MRLGPSRWLLPLGASLAVLVAACGGNAAGDAEPAAEVVTPAATASPSATPTAVPTPDFEAARQLRREKVAARIRRDFPSNELWNRTVDLSQIVIGLPRDSLSAIFEPDFGTIEEVSAWLNEREPVIAFTLNGETRAYPIRVLIWHEIVNDVVGGEPVLITYCPLCNTAIAFRREVGGEERVFGVSGMLRRNDLIMYDRESETLWQQITGEGIVGVEAGTQLEFLPSQIVAFGDFKATFPESEVLLGPVGSEAVGYEDNPYVYYDSTERTYFANDEFDDHRLDAKERVLTVELNGDPVAFSFSALSERVVIEAEVGGVAIVAFWQPGALSPLDEEFIIASRNVGAAGAFIPEAGGRRLTFEVRDGAIVDRETGSTWNVLGLATDGPLAGSTLEPVLSGNHFWFAWSVFEPETRVVTGG